MHAGHVGEPGMDLQHVGAPLRDPGAQLLQERLAGPGHPRAEVGGLEHGAKGAAAGGQLHGQLRVARPGAPASRAAGRTVPARWRSRAAGRSGCIRRSGGPASPWRGGCSGSMPSVGKNLPVARQFAQRGVAGLANAAQRETVEAGVQVQELAAGLFLAAGGDGGVGDGEHRNGECRGQREQFARLPRCPARGQGIQHARAPGAVPRPEPAQLGGDEVCIGAEARRATAGVAPGRSHASGGNWPGAPGGAAPAAPRTRSADCHPRGPRSRVRWRARRCHRQRPAARRSARTRPRTLQRAWPRD